MKIQQLSLFLENKPGRLVEPCRMLAAAGVNIRTLSLADTAQYGILRMIVSDWTKASELFQQSGYAFTTTEVLAVEVPDRPGGLAGILEIFEGTDINVEYMYALTYGREDRAVLIFRFDEPDEAIARLRAAGIGVLDSVEIYNGGPSA
jgi:hypothetical protein